MLIGSDFATVLPNFYDYVDQGDRGQGKLDRFKFEVWTEDKKIDK